MTLEQILAGARALMTEEVDVDEPVAAAARRRRVLPRVPVCPPTTPNKQNVVAVQATRTCGMCSENEARARGQHYSFPT